MIIIINEIKQKKGERKPALFMISPSKSGIKLVINNQSDVGPIEAVFFFFALLDRGKFCFQIFSAI